MCSNGMFLIFTSIFPFLGRSLGGRGGGAELQLRLNIPPLPGTGRNTLNQPNIWLTVFLATLLCSLPVLAFRFVSFLLRPTINDKVPPPPPPSTSGLFFNTPLSSAFPVFLPFPTFSFLSGAVQDAQ